MRRFVPLLLLVACGEPAVEIADGGSRDSGAVQEADAAVRDGGAIVERDGGFADAGQADAGVADAGEADGGLPSSPDPVLFVHGINGSSSEFDLLRMRLVADGWPADRLFALDFADPQWGCNVDNADAIAAEVTRIRQATGAARIDLVAHSMGTLSSRHYIKHLGGTEVVNTYVTLGGLHHGNRLSCLNPLDVCVWQELCPTKPFLTALNADPATPGALAWVSIYSADDETVPTSSAHLDGAENIEVRGVGHAGPGGLTEDEGVYREVRRVLEYAAW